MLQYLKEAFLLRVPTPGLGSIPWNLLGVGGFAILGLGQPGFWLLGLGLEAAYLFGLATHPRFQQWVAARNLEVSSQGIESQQAALLQRLIPEAKTRLQKLEHRCAQIYQIYQDSQLERFIAEGNIEALKKLQWIFLKLLLARQTLAAGESDSDEKELQRQKALLEKELQRSGLSDTLRDSKEATLRILNQRLANLEKREEILAEIDSDLTRIEAQVELALDNAAMQGKTEAITGNINLASHLLDDGIYGDSTQTIAAIEQSYSTPPSSPQSQ